MTVKLTLITQTAQLDTNNT